MATVTQAAAVSHVGKVRSNNQDSGYAGRDLFVVADGMGGHAGGDVASAVALTRIIEADKPYASAHDAEFALQAGLVAANQLLAETVFEHSELTGMGTTVSALARVGRHVAIAHIGDSRIYLFRRGELSQISADHTFVQRLVDSGRITPEEALVHPRRSVLMRVLGDVDAAPEVDTQVLDTHTGDRWLLCSDGLSSYVSEERITEILATAGTPDTVADALVKESLDHGAPDNVTVVVVDVLDEDDETAASRPAPEPVVVGSASQPLAFGDEPAKRAVRIPSLLLHPLRATTAARDAQFEPESDQYLEALIAEDKRRALRRRVTWLVGVTLIVAGLVLACVLGYRWTQSRYYVGESDGVVAVYNGVQQTIGPIELSHVYARTEVQVDDLQPFYRQQVEQTINADSLAGAEEIVNRLQEAAGG
ncbi:PP2C family protein-serine/threonine phosphatase [Clavibacter michiganensis]|uniref:Serine/threonine protein phosphatase n=1 Tax=Clavibacter michiganensis subsp. michiganensis (strain NCPPB 382) TaxID=443906 RepID=A5CLV1_CLAM3|nr:protein phosphatase 2C domain-containing protein [Clavibacter michiganensis]KAF0259684.1 PP2C-family Ser/Thr phosphatase [Clavibacter michiganensis subsp. michiganensis]MBE3079643.1 serine/threonine-protein phosphatase [Clavibacter michiganensis subsp. michiganensis]MBF4638467.1 serine/threonine-protein phosphatase [Clavibacter michiganensis subsp. michiganensis]MBW8027027.1 serine/threonine-protein phosphatase [Clavibacter michiganensis subsp. michiganensis]MDO4019537.1 protein phosphatase